MASLRTLIAEIIDKIIINEIGEASVESLEYKKISDYNYSFRFEFDSNFYRVKVQFELIEDDISKQY